jgi:hypothetical protein
MEIEFKGRKQFGAYFNRTQRWAWIVAHRRSGKTVGCIQDILKRAAECTRSEPRYAYIAPTYTQAKDVAFSYLKRLASPIAGAVSESELSVTLAHNGARIRLYGAENYDRMRGLYFDGAVLDEAGDMDPRAWSEVVRPALSDRQGWATFIGTPKGRNQFYEIGQRAKKDADWLTLTLKASETGLLPDSELADARKQLTEEQYAQEYECSFDAAIIGAYYGKEMRQADAEGRICGVPYDRAALVWTAWDLGIGDSTAIWFVQVVGRELHVIDYYEASGVGLDHYADIVRGKGYQYAGHILPHDAEAKELGTGKSRLEVMWSLGIDGQVLPVHRVDDGINAVRMALPRMWFDAEKCARGIDCLRMYRADYDEKLQTLKPRPVHDWASHGADAMRYLVMGLDEQGADKAWNPRKLQVI